MGVWFLLESFAAAGMAWSGLNALGVGEKASILLGASLFLTLVALDSLVKKICAALKGARNG